MDLFYIDLDLFATILVFHLDDAAGDPLLDGRNHFFPIHVVHSGEKWAPILMPARTRLKGRLTFDLGFAVARSLTRTWNQFAVLGEGGAEAGLYSVSRTWPLPQPVTLPSLTMCRMRARSSSIRVPPCCANRFVFLTG